MERCLLLDHISQRFLTEGFVKRGVVEEDLQHEVFSAGGNLIEDVHGVGLMQSEVM